MRAVVAAAAREQSVRRMQDGSRVGMRYSRNIRQRQVARIEGPQPHEMLQQGPREQQGRSVAHRTRPLIRR